MSSDPGLWLAIGSAGGISHGILLGWAVFHSPERAAALGILRLAAPAALLVGAAVSHGLLPAALGWALGFAGSCFLVVRWRRR